MHAACTLQKQTNTHGDTDPICSCHLHNDPNSCLVEEATVSPHHHRGSLAVPQVNGGEDTLDEVVKVVPPGLEHVDRFPQATSAGPLVGVGGRGYSQHLQWTVVHCCRIKNPTLMQQHGEPGDLLFGGKAPVCWHGKWYRTEWEG